MATHPRPCALVVLAILGALAAPTLATAQQLLPGQQFPTNAFPNFVASADFNGDGKPDVVTADQGTNTLSVLLGDGLGALAAPVALGTGSSPSEVAAADFNGDGTIDLACTCYGGNSVVTFQNLGGGAFAPGVAQTVAGSPAGLGIGDFNADLRKDIAVACNTGNNVAVLYGLAGGGFGAPQYTAVQLAPSHFAVGKLDLNSTTDLAVVHGTGTVEILFGKLAGGFNFGTPVNVGFGAGNIDSFDFTGDGRTDLLVTNISFGYLTPATGSGTGTFTVGANVPCGPTPFLSAHGDLDGDGKPDALVALPNSNLIQVMLGNGSSFGAAVDFAAGADPDSIALADFDADGRLDAAASNFKQGTVSILRGAGNGALLASPTFPGAPSGARGLALADLDGDADLDLAVACDGSASLALFAGAGGGAFAAPTYVPAGAVPSTVTAADLDGDGRLDLVAAQTTTLQVAVLQALGSGYAAPATLVASGNPVDALVADQNADGMPDLWVPWGQGVQGGFDLWLGSPGGPVFSGSFALAGAPIAAVALDLNADGIADLAAIESAPAQLSSVLSTGLAAFAPGAAVAPAAAATALAAADLDQDGRQDLAVAGGGGSGSVAVYLGSGGGSFALAHTLAVGPNPSGLAAGDFDRDVRPDLAVVHKHGSFGTGSTGSLGVLRNLGAGFAAEKVFGAGRLALQARVGDLDANGAADVVVANNGALTPAQTITVLLNETPAAVGTSLFGVGTPGCFGTLALGANTPPAIGSAAFAITGTNAPRNALGLCLLCDAADPGGNDFFGIGATLHVNLLASTTVLGFDFYSDAGGTATTAPGPIPNDPLLVGAAFAAQGVWLESAAGLSCGPSPFALVSSRGLALVVQ